MKHAKKITGKKPASNDEGVPEDEMTLAQLIQNAAGRGLTSVRGVLFGRRYDNAHPYQLLSDGIHVELDVEYEYDTDKVGSLSAPPVGATCACALGAQLLSPAVDNPVTAVVVNGNDIHDGVKFTRSYTEYADLRSMQIGAAYEQALRPSK